MQKIEIIFYFTITSNSPTKMATRMINPAFVAMVEKKLDLNCDNHRFYLPIDTIADLKVMIYILRWKRHDDTFAYDFAIDLDNIYMSDMDRSPYRLYSSKSKTSVKDTLDDFMDFTDKVVIDKMNGKLSMNDELEKESDLLKEFCDLFADDKNVKVSINECCVCYVPTVCTTNCNHNVCVSCISKIENKEDENDDEDDFPFKKCPMCRVNIQYYN